MSQDHNGSPKSQPTEKKLRSLKNLRPFKPGPDPRRNLKGRPKSFDHFRELAQSLSHEDLTLKGGMNHPITVIKSSWRRIKPPSIKTLLKILLASTVNVG